MASPKKMAMLTNGLTSAISIPAGYASGPGQEAASDAQPASAGDLDSTLNINAITTLTAP